LISYPKSVEENDALKAWIAQRIPDYRSGSHTVCIGIEREQKLLAVVAWDNWRGRDIEVTFASDNPRWATRQTIMTLLAYPFIQLGCQRVTSFVYKSNKRARRLNEGLGFVQEGKHRDAGKNLEPVFSYGLTKRDFVAKYLKRVKDGKQETTSAAAGS